MKAVARAWFWRGAETLGSMVAKPAARLLDEMDFLAVVLASAGLIVRGQWRFLFGHTVQQIYFTAVQRAYLFTVVGSIIGAAFADGSVVDNFATEVFISSGQVEPGADGKPIATVSAALVDYTGALASGRLVKGNNPVLMTFELALQVLD
jgi:hypothetical protein